MLTGAILKHSTGEEAEQPQGLHQRCRPIGCDAFLDPLEPKELAALALREGAAGPDLHVSDREVRSRSRHRKHPAAAEVPPRDIQKLTSGTYRAAGFFYY